MVRPTRTMLKKMGITPPKRSKPAPLDVKVIQTKVLEKAKKNNMTGKNFRMQNPKDKDVQALYKANPNIKSKDIDRLKIRKLEEKGNKKLVTSPKGKIIKGRIKSSKDYGKFTREKQTIKQVKEAALARKETVYQKQRILDIIKGKQDRLKTVVVPELKKALNEDIKYLRGLIKKGETL